MTTPTPFPTSTGEFAVKLETGTFTTREIFNIYYAMVRAESKAKSDANKAKSGVQ